MVLMNVRRTRRLLWTVAMLLVLGSVAIGWIGAVSPYVEPVVKSHEMSIEPVNSSSEAGLPSLASFEKLAQRNLRQQLFDPPPPPPAPKPVRREVPPPPVRLVGTIIDANTPVAMIADPRGKVEFKRIGDRVGDESNHAVILTIQSESVTLKHQEKTIELVMERAAGR